MHSPSPKQLTDDTRKPEPALGWSKQPMAKSLPAYFAALLVAAASCGSEVALPSAIPDASPTAKTATAQPVAAPTGAQSSTNAAESMRNVVLPSSMVSPVSSPNSNNLDWDESDLDWDDIDFLEETAAALSKDRSLRSLARRLRRTNRSTRSRIDQSSLKLSAAKRISRTRAAALSKRSREKLRKKR